MCSATRPRPIHIHTGNLSYPAQVLDLYLAGSLGDETFTAWALLPLRTVNPIKSASNKGAADERCTVEGSLLVEWCPAVTNEPLRVTSLCSST